jgi:branched-chain amino acid transport system permease protein
MKNILSFDMKNAVFQGLIAGFISVSASAIGMVELFGERYLLAGVVTMGQIVIFAAPAVFAYNSVEKQAGQRTAASVLRAAVIGAVSAILLLLLIWAALSFDIRSVLINVSPTLIGLLTFGLGPQTGSIVLFGSMIVVCAGMALLHFLPGIYTRSIMYAGATTVLIGLLSQILTERIRNFFGMQAASLIFQSNALQLVPGLLIFVIAGAIFYWREKNRKTEVKAKRSQPKTLRGQIIRNAPLSILLLILPLILGTYLTEITNNVGIFLLMGLGLNIVVGLAGLLDLGYVAFFAIGAYTMAILTSTGSLGIADMSFWVALPISVAVAAMFGLLLGIPVLRMRGDYLAIVTLGFGEIIRILALSDMLKPFIGGAQGILQIPKPNFFGTTLVQPEQLYYVVLAGALLAAFISNRLRESRVGRTWIAMREDEDVAEAMGINLVKTKLLAFAIGAGFSGLAGAIFAPKLTSIFPHSFNLLISINVLALIIVGGLGSIPGTIVGAIILVGLPELLREFAEFRWLIYGLLLVIMMLNKPEGFIPSEVIRRELHSGDEPNLKPTP